MFGLELAALGIACLVVLFFICKLIIILAPAVISTCVAAGCGATAWGMGTTLPFDDVALLFTTLQLIATVVIGYWALGSWKRVALDLGLVAEKKPARGRKRSRRAYA